MYVASLSMQRSTERYGLHMMQVCYRVGCFVDKESERETGEPPSHHRIHWNSPETVGHGMAEQHKLNKDYLL